MRKPKLSYFCELEAGPLTELFQDLDLSLLNEMQADISLGIIDLTPERASVVQRLNQAGIPVIAWLLLPKEEGYWFNLDNAQQAAARYQDFLAWTNTHGLRWQGIGLDIEPDIREMEGLFQRQWKILPSLLGRIVNGGRLRKARKSYLALVQQIRADGYQVDTYQFPFIVDERLMGSTLLQRAAGLIDLPSDREVLMLYSSFLRPNGPGVLWSYGRHAEAVGLGVTGGGVEMEGVKTRPLSWNELARDLRLAYVFQDDIHIFSLEGCVQQGFLERLKDFQWDMPIFDPIEQYEKVDAIRHTAQTVLWISSKAWLLIPGVLAVLYMINRLRKRRR